jgi:CBS-domain-containing membrane protein
MKAVDVMVRDVVTVSPNTDVAEAVRLLGEHDVSALPVVDEDGAVVGIISEGDLLRREEIGTEKHRPWWIEASRRRPRLPTNLPNRTASASAG